MPDGGITAFTLSMGLANDASTSERSEPFLCHVSSLNHFRPPPWIRCCLAPRLYQVGLADQQLNARYQDDAEASASCGTTRWWDNCGHYGRALGKFA